jgi:uncharacterized protein (UPF0548 family)
MPRLLAVAALTLRFYEGGWVGYHPITPTRTMMFLLRRPSSEKIREFLAAQSRLDLTYTAIGATSDVLPPGYVVNHTRIKLGSGEKVFRAAKSALAGWKQFHLGWMEASPVDTAIKEGQVVVLLVRSVGLWWLNACRIVTVVDEADRFGFAYGTLPEHAGTGEERFLIERDPQDGSVWYDILAFSRPHHFLVRLGAPYLRVIQRRFGRESAAAMLQAVESGDEVMAGQPK